MSDNYPKRGKLSEDGKVYTHTDGTVHELKESGMYSCLGCSFRQTQDVVPACKFCGAGIFVAVKEAQQIPSTEEQEACDMARAMIQQCGNVGCFRRCTHDVDHKCVRILDKSCPARSHLALKKATRRLGGEVMARVQIEIVCPTCGFFWDADVEALCGSGTVPINEETCEECGTKFNVEATIDVSVKEVKG